MKLNRNDLNRGVVFSAAADILEKEGWLQGKFSEFDKGFVDNPNFVSRVAPDKQCARCAGGAIVAALARLHGLGTSYYGTVWEFIDTAGKHVGEDWGYSIALWNDDSLRNKDEVVKLLRHLAREYDEHP